MRPSQGRTWKLSPSLAMGNRLLHPAIEEHDGIDAVVVALGSGAPRFC